MIYHYKKLNVTLADEEAGIYYKNKKQKKNKNKERNTRATTNNQ